MIILLIFSHFIHQKDRIKTIVEQTVKECENSLFVFDETDKIPIGLVDSIKAYIDYHSEVDGIDFRKSVFIFLRYMPQYDIFN